MSSTVRTVFRDDLFAGRVALITGGGTGIGLRTAREMAQLGATVVIASRKTEHLEKGAAAIEKQGGKVHTLVCNIRDEESVKHCVSETLAQAGRLDYLVNNAGGQFPSPAGKISKKGWHAVVETNLTGTFLMCREVFEQAFASHGGAIVNVTANVFNGFPLLAHTGAARAGVINLTKSLAAEWGRQGVRVNAVAPGVIESSGLDTYAPEYRKMIRKVGVQNPASRPGTEAEVAAAILFLLSPGAAYISGETIRMDGGESVHNAFLPHIAHDRMPPFKD